MQVLLETIGAIYAAASGEQPWVNVGDLLCRAIGAERTYLTIPTVDAAFPNLLHEGSRYNVDPFDTEYAQRFHRINPYRMAAVRFGQDPSFEPVALHSYQIAPINEVRSTDYYKEFATRRQTKSFMGASLDSSGDFLIAVFRDKTNIMYTNNDAARFQLVLPHLKRGLQLRQALAPGLVGSPKAGYAVLDALPIGAFIVDRRAHLKFANEAGERMASQASSGLRIINTGRKSDGLVLGASYGADDASLRTAIARAADGGAGGVLRVRGALGEDDRTPLVAVMATPVPVRLSAGLSGGLSAPLDGLALVLARDLTKADGPKAESLMSMFGLSPGEAQVAISVLGGATAETVAAARGVTINTVRRQIQDVLRKTEASNLRDFERIAALLADLRSRDPLAS